MGKPLLIPMGSSHHLDIAQPEGEGVVEVLETKSRDNFGWNIYPSGN